MKRLEVVCPQLLALLSSVMFMLVSVVVVGSARGPELSQHNRPQFDSCTVRLFWCHQTVVVVFTLTQVNPTLNRTPLGRPKYTEPRLSERIWWTLEVKQQEQALTCTWM